MKKEMTRDEAIKYLVQKDFDFITDELDNLGEELLYSYLEDGFKGYWNFTDEELEDEVKQRRELELMDSNIISIRRDTKHFGRHS
jgi:hypothetical protein